MLTGKVLLLSVLVCLMVTMVQEAQAQRGRGLLAAALIGLAIGYFKNILIVNTGKVTCY